MINCFSCIYRTCLYSSFSILYAISALELDLPERVEYWWIYIFYCSIEELNTAIVWYIFSATGIRCTEDNDKLHEMLGVVEHIRKTDRIKKILTGCVRVTETASLDGEVKFILLELKWCRFSLATRHTSMELRQLSDYSLLYLMMEDKTFKIMTIYSVVILRNTERKIC